MSSSSLNPDSAVPSSIGLVWFRRDLRLTDNLAWLEACRHNHSHVLPLIIINPDDWADDPLLAETGSEACRVGRHRQQFWRQSVEDLQQQLVHYGHTLHAFCGSPDDVFSQLAEALPPCPLAVYLNREPGTEEQADAQLTHTRLSRTGRAVDWRMASTGQALYNVLPFQNLPKGGFTPFRQRVESHAQPRLPVELPPTPPAAVPAQWVNTLTVDPFAQLQVTKLQAPITASPRFVGGRQAGLLRLDYYLDNGIDQYKQTRNQLLGDEGGARFSPWLALGCLSSAEIWHAITAYESDHGDNEGTYWLKFELLWREYFRLLMYEHHQRLFVPAGLKSASPITWRRDKARFAQWVAGETGFPLVDAAMRELVATGYASNRARQNAASFLAKTWGIDWTWGARYFEQQLVDYDVASNWGNWAYLAGVGTDPRNRVFNVEKQARDYDPEGTYVDYWLNPIPTT